MNKKISFSDVGKTIAYGISGMDTGKAGKVKGEKPAQINEKDTIDKSLLEKAMGKRKELSIPASEQIEKKREVQESPGKAEVILKETEIEKSLSSIPVTGSYKVQKYQEPKEVKETAPVMMKEGAFVIDGKPAFLLSADYPYFRDNREDWSKQLDNLKKMNVNVITCYIPWRHHAPEDPIKGKGEYDFSGKLKSSTDVLEFVRLCKEKNMKLVVKPGPFVHAELNNGGLPDYLPGESYKSSKDELFYKMPHLSFLPLPKNEKKPEFFTDPSGKKYPLYATPIPAPLDHKYNEYVQDWLKAVTENVVLPNQYPDGPIIGVQILNEGTYSEGQRSINSYDYSSSSIANYRDFLSQKYDDLNEYNKLHGTDYSKWNEIEPPRKWEGLSKKKDAKKYIDWAEFSSDHYKRILSSYTGYMEDVKVPFIININLPYEDDMDSYMARNNQMHFNDKAGYGYTSWVGVVPYDKKAFRRYKITAKKNRGVCMEENWGFSKIYTEEYKSTQPSFFQSLLYMSLGTTGMNIYTGVTVDNWDEYMDSVHKDPYPFDAPISEKGEFRDKFWTAHQLGSFINNEKEYMTAEVKPEAIAWGMYMPYACAAAWQKDPNEWKKLGFSDKPRGAQGGWDSFMERLSRNDTESGIAYLGEQKLKDMKKHKMIVLDGADWMDKNTQNKLAAYVKEGGTLLMTSNIPGMDENFKPYSILKDEIFKHQDKQVEIKDKIPVNVSGMKNNGTAENYVRTIKMPPSGESIARANINGKDEVVGYRVKVGKGNAVFLGFHPWTEDPDSNDNVGVVESIAKKYAGVSHAEAWDEANSPLVDVSQYENSSRGIQYVYTISREDKAGKHKINYTGLNGQVESFGLNLPAYSGAVIGFEKGKIRSALIKAYNDHDKSFIEPRFVSDEQEFSADKPCDIEFSKKGNTYTFNVTNIDADVESKKNISIASLQNKGEATITFPVDPSKVKKIIKVGSNGKKVEVKWESAGKNIKFKANDSRVWDPTSRFHRPSDPKWTSGYKIVVRE